MLDQSRLLPWDRWVLEPPLVMDHVAYLARFWDNVTAKRVFCQNSIFRPKISIVAIIKTKSATAAFSLLFLSFSSLFVFLLSFSFITAILELFWRLLKPFSMKWLQKWLGWFSKIRLDIHSTKCENLPVFIWFLKFLKNLGQILTQLYANPTCHYRSIRAALSYA